MNLNILTGISTIGTLSLFSISMTFMSQDIDVESMKDSLNSKSVNLNNEINQKVEVDISKDVPIESIQINTHNELYEDILNNEKIQSLNKDKIKSFNEEKKIDSIEETIELSLTLNDLKKPSQKGIDFIEGKTKFPTKKELNELGKIYSLPENLLYSVMLKESSGDQYALSHKNAKGLFQFIPSTAEDFGLIIDGVDYRTDKWRSAEAAARYIAWIFTYFHNDKDRSDIDNYKYVLAAYNAGISNVKKSTGFKIPPFKETQEYVKYIIGHVKGDYYLVKRGDKLNKIASDYNIESELLSKINKGIKQETLIAGTYLVVNKNADEINKYTVQSGDSLYRISKKYSVNMEEIKIANGLTSNLINIGQKITIPF